MNRYLTGMTSFATPEGTHRFHERIGTLKTSRALGKTKLRASWCGFGTYRTRVGIEAHENALFHAIERGVNLIDTSTNYGGGASEVLVGSVLSRLFNDQKLSRDEIIVVTKAGYIQGDLLDETRALSPEQLEQLEVTQYRPDCWHSISPAFLEDQISRSLHRLKLDRIDFLLLHNPEYFLKATPNHDEYYSRIEKAFRHLETEVARGRISAYGISSNTFPEAKESEDFTSLETLYEISEKIAPGSHHFQLIQFPFNLFEPGAALEENNSFKTVTEFALSKGLATLVNRPLNAFYQHEIIRLADFEKARIDADHEVARWIAEVMTLESHLPAESSGVRPKNLNWGHSLKKNMHQIQDYLAWKEMLEHQIEPLLEYSLEQIHDTEWKNAYRVATRTLFDAVSAQLKNQMHADSERLKRALDAETPRLSELKTLSQRALSIEASVPGVDCVLVGMRNTEYVDDVLGSNPALTPDEAFAALDAIPKYLGA